MTNNMTNTKFKIGDLVTYSEYNSHADYPSERIKYVAVVIKAKPILKRYDILIQVHNVEVKNVHAKDLEKLI